MMFDSIYIRLHFTPYTRHPDVSVRSACVDLKERTKERKNE